MRTFLFLFLLICISSLFLFSCTKNIAEFSSSNDSLTKSYEKSEVFNEASGLWLTPQEIPYTTKNMRLAHSRLLSGDSHYKVPSDILPELMNLKDVSASHWAISISPINLSQQRALERDSTILISYIPFGYDIAQGLNDSMCGDVCIEEDCQQFLDCDSLSVSEEITPSILYAIWPVGKQVPDSLDYSIEYELYLPSYYSDNHMPSEAEVILEKEALYLVGINADEGLTKADEPRQPAYSDGRDGRQGYVKVYDNSICSYVPLPDVKVQIGVAGVPMLSQYTDSDGFFAFSITSPISYSLNFILQTGDWTITEYGSSAAVIVNAGRVRDYWPSSSDTFAIINLSGNNTTTIQRALSSLRNNGCNNTPYWTLSPNMEITYNDNVHPSGYLGTFTPSTRDINIYYQNSSKRLIGTVIHEVGHAIQMESKGSIDLYYLNPKILRESFASFMGWYYGCQYYVDLGIYSSFPVTDITGNNRQRWHKTDTTIYRNYSPIFIDMVDARNQHVSSSSPYPYDLLSGCPLPIIKDLAMSKTSIEDIMQFSITHNSYFRTTTENIETYFDDYVYRINNVGYEQ